MRRHVLGTAAVGAVLLASACSASSPGREVAGPSGVGASSTASSTVASRGTDSVFCRLARSVGQANLGLADEDADPDVPKLLSQIHQLDAVAPPDLKRDFDAFADFEHSVLVPGAAPSEPQVAGRTAAALHHVTSYFVDVCQIA
jgi:hypothetical protein